jgi:integration host factor subunit beta
MMTRADLTEAVSRALDISRTESETIVVTMLDGIVRALRTGDKVEIRRFGSFGTRQRRPRIGRNPKTGARVEVPAKRIPYFRPSKELSELVNSAPAPMLDVIDILRGRPPGAAMAATTGDASSAPSSSRTTSPAFLTSPRADRARS